MTWHPIPNPTEIHRAAFLAYEHAETGDVIYLLWMPADAIDAEAGSGDWTWRLEMDGAPWDFPTKSFGIARVAAERAIEAAEKQRTRFR